ncbi:MAG TPA: DMT family transporter [Opitutaceae bacterium]|nr:DMT family transporter [Opitutaceae bacterium]
MLFAFLTTILWSFSAIFARRLVGTLGSTLANLSRCLLAVLLLGLWAFLFGQGCRGEGLWWYLLSGMVGFGLGDISLYFALARIGSRLTILLTQCLAAPFAILIEWLWLDTALTLPQLLCTAGVLAGVSAALVPKDNLHIPSRTLWSGIGFGVLAALGQGLGAVISRKAYALSLASGVRIDGGTAAFQRILAGAAIGFGAWWLLRHRAGEQRWSGLTLALQTRRFRLTLLAAALCGPVLGVGCYQWALATAPSGLVLPIVALCPIAIIPFSWWLEGDRPKPRSIIGGAAAVACAIALARLRTG